MDRTEGMAVLLVAVVLALVVGVGGLAGTGMADDDTVTVELSVTTPDGDPIGGADVTITWDDEERTVRTVSDGRALVDVTQGANLTIELEHDEYVKNVPAEAIDVEAGDRIELVMHPPATATIEVVDEDGAIEDARVTLRKIGQSEVTARGHTGTDGIYESPAVEEGRYTVWVSKPGYLRERFTLDLDGDVEERVELEESTVTVSLRTQDANLDPPERVRADVTVSSEGERILTTTTDDRGTREISLGVNTDYDVLAEGDGYQTTEAELEVDEEPRELVLNLSRTRTLTIAPDNERVVSGETLRLEVTDEYDRPASDVSILLDGETVGETDENGVARIEIPGTGEFELEAERDGVTAEPVTITGVGTNGEVPEDEDEEEADEDGTPGFGIAAALAGLLVATVGYLARRS